MIVVDTNILVYFYVQGNQSKLVTELFLQDSDWIAPSLWLSEFRNTMMLYKRKDLLNMSTILDIVKAAENLMKNRSFLAKSSDVLNLASISQCSAYECEFVALAKKFQIPLVTADKKIVRSFPETAVSINQFLE